jgi:5'(3')-deoxyribonucleotidase
MVEYLLTQYNSEYQDDLKIESITDWDLSKFVKLECGEKINNYFKRPYFFSNPKPRKDAQEVLFELHKSGHEIHVVTSYYPGACVDKYKYIEDHFPFINNRNIIFCNNKHLITTDVLVDDAYHNLLNFKGTPIMFDRPWNKKYGETFHRIHNWYEFKEFS